MPNKLNLANLDRISKDIKRPTYDRSRLKHGIVHIGVGGFHRAHQAVYLDDLLHTSGNEAWGLCGIGLLPHDKRMAEIMAAQDCLYTVVERDNKGDVPRIIGSMTAFLWAPENPEAVIEKMASPDCRIVALTITEGGYYINQGTGELDAKHPDIVKELSNTGSPVCVFGYLAAALSRRRERGMKPFTAQSCDNIQMNGDMFRKTFLAFLKLKDKSLHDWVAAECAFPNSMVDRITPATTDENRAMVETSFGITDAWPVVTEPFRQWVIEDRFPLGRPAWEEVGAQLVEEVLPYEKMKIRLLNAGHQAIAYVGMLMGYALVNEAMEDPLIRKFARKMMDDEVTPILPPVPGVDLEAYKGSLIERFSNRSIKDTLARLGTDGSARIPKFVLPSIAEAVSKGGRISCLSFTVASWLWYLQGKDDAGKAMPMSDAMLATLRAAPGFGGDDPRGLLAIHELFGDLSASAAFTDQVVRSYGNLRTRGARETLVSLVAGQ